MNRPGLALLAKQTLKWSAAQECACPPSVEGYFGRCSVKPVLPTCLPFEEGWPKSNAEFGDVDVLKAGRHKMATLMDGHNGCQHAERPHSGSRPRYIQPRPCRGHGAAQVCTGSASAGLMKRRQGVHA